MVGSAATIRYDANETHDAIRQEITDRRIGYFAILLGDIEVDANENALVLEGDG